MGGASQVGRQNVWNNSPYDLSNRKGNPVEVNEFSLTNITSLHFSVDSGEHCVPSTILPPRTVQLGSYALQWHSSLCSPLEVMPPSFADSAELVAVPGPGVKELLPIRGPDDFDEAAPEKLSISGNIVGTLPIS